MSKKRGMSADEKTKALQDLYLEEVSEKKKKKKNRKTLNLIRCGFCGFKGDSVEFERVGESCTQKERHWCVVGARHVEKKGAQKLKKKKKNVVFLARRSATVCERCESTTC
jgi:hypothetical protein